MVKRRRNYKAEYRRRMARGKAKGLSKTLARGHRKAGEKKSKLSARERAVEDHRFQVAFRALKRDKKIAKAAKDARLSPEKLRQVAIEKGILEKRGRRWVVKSDIARRVLIYSNGHRAQIVVGTQKAASLVGKYMSAVGWFLTTGDRSYLKPFAKKSVVDDAGKRHPLEVRPNYLYRISFSGGQSFEQIYRIVV